MISVCCVQCTFLPTPAAQAESCIACCSRSEGLPTRSFIPSEQASLPPHLLVRNLFFHERLYLHIFSLVLGHHNDFLRYVCSGWESGE